MSVIPLTKLANIQADLALLPEELVQVDRYFNEDQPQHASRRWEYALALRAQTTWYDRDVLTDADRPQGPVIDVGGAGSPFWRMVSHDRCRVIDPKGGPDLAEHLRLGAALASEVYCLSVLEHVEDLDQFCYHLGCLVAPGGLLFLTMDYGTDLPDQYHFHWDRRRIFDTKAWETLREKFGDFTLLGTRDRTYHGNQVYDFSICSLALVKRT